MRWSALNAKALAFCRKRIASGGDHGLGNYYLARVTSNSLWCHTDKRLVRYVRNAFPRGTSVLEICAGGAQVSHALALAGFVAHACELTDARADFARELGKALGSSAFVIQSHWQLLPASKYELVFTNNAVSSHVSIEEDHESFEQILQAGNDVILKPSLYGTKDYGRLIEFPTAAAVFNVGSGLRHWVGLDNRHGEDYAN